jgi:hypothetical protein
MAEEAAPAPKEDVDVLKATVWFLLCLVPGLAGVWWLLSSQRDAYRAAVEAGEKNLKAMAPQYDQVVGLLRQYKDSGSDEARTSTRTWLKQRFTQAGIADSQVTTEKWRERPARDHVEHYVEVVVKGVRIEQAMHFLWAVEKVSPKMKPILVKLSRNAPANAPETDAWELRAEFGYRVPRGTREGS